MNVQRSLSAVAAMVLTTILCACNKAPEAIKVDKDIAASMEAFKSRKIHAELTPEILASIADDAVEQAVIDYVSTKIGDDYDHEIQIVSKLPIGAQALYITWWVEAEVNNGGFNQYYWNSAGQFADQAAEAFEFFSAHEHAALMREANSVHAMEAETMKKYKERGTMEAFSDSYKESKLGPLDNRFFEMKENLSALRIAKIRAMPEFFSGK
jgi:hypothetical protein